MKKIYFTFLVLMSSFCFGQINVGIIGTVGGAYINEFHYDNVSSDVGEFIEIAGPAGTDLSNYTLTLYNGDLSSTFLAYKTVVLSGTIPDEGSGVGAVLAVFSGSIQNGGPDGIALSSSTITDVQFLSYEGSFTAGDGAATGLTSLNINVSESSATPTGYSLEYDETSMTWVVITDDSPGVFAQGTILSISDLKFLDFKIYPNPTNSNFITISSSSTEAMTVQVFDILGKQLKEERLTTNKLNISDLKAGVYIMKIQQNAASSSKRLMIH